jgi:predicted ester cyclase
MSLENNKAIVRSYFERAVNQGDLDWLDQIIAPSFGAAGAGAHASGLAGPALARQAVVRLRQAFPDIQYTVEDMTAEADRVAVHVTLRGTHQGEFMGIAATGRRVTNSGAELAILADGQIVAAGWQFHDEIGMLRQLGRLPEHGRH